MLQVRINLDCVGIFITTEGFRNRSLILFCNLCCFQQKFIFTDCGAMASLIDSTAQFDQRCRDINLSPVTCTAMRVAGITSLGILAYSHGQPGQAVVDADFTTWVQGTIGAGISLADTAGIKRLLFEAHTH